MEVLKSNRRLLGLLVLLASLHQERSWKRISPSSPVSSGVMQCMFLFHDFDKISRENQFKQRMKAAHIAG